MQKITKHRKPRKAPAPPIMSMSDLAKLGGGKVAYIKVMSTDEAKELFLARRSARGHRPVRAPCCRWYASGANR